uniref:cupin domain-containing protein n=1 Tax=uncultured Sphingomonas sp. TaxID=158754 RepID=UPI0035C9F29D
MSRPVRRIVTGHDASGQSIVTEDGPPSRVFDTLGEPGLVFHEIWSTGATPAMIERSGGEPVEAGLMLAPPPGGTRIRILDIPVEGTDADFDAVFANIGGSEAHVASDRHASFHRTRSIDYGIVIEGEITLLLDKGETIVRAGDVVVQRGTNHGWVNRGTKPCRVAFVLIDGAWSDGLA